MSILTNTYTCLAALQDKLRVYCNAMKVLEDRLNSGLPAGLFLNFNDRKDMKTHLSRLNTFLAPLMQGDR